MKAQITLRSGAQIEFDIEELTSSRHPLTGALTKLNWTTPKGPCRKLHTVELDQIVAIVAIREPGDEDIEADGGEQDTTGGEA